MGFIEDFNRWWKESKIGQVLEWGKIGTLTRLDKARTLYSEYDAAGNLRGKFTFFHDSNFYNIARKSEKIQGLWRDTYGDAAYKEYVESQKYGGTYNLSEYHDASGYQTGGMGEEDIAPMDPYEPPDPWTVGWDMERVAENRNTSLSVHNDADESGPQIAGNWSPPKNVTTYADPLGTYNQPYSTGAIQPAMGIIPNAGGGGYNLGLPEIIGNDEGSGSGPAWWLIGGGVALAGFAAWYFFMR